ncbi:MAG: hypothetical protein CL607_15130 [Anaerolineaceae bacterium]|nr:hypothetical protein [Anaerolineaceae bacterium]
MRLSEAVALFLSQKRETTERSYMYILRDLVRVVGDWHIEAIDHEAMTKYSDDMKSRKWKSDFTWNKHVKTVRAFFNYCVDIGLIKTSPATALKTRRTDNLVPKDRAFPEEDLRKLLTYTQFRPKEHALVLFLADSGCRRRDASELKWSDVDLENRQAFIHHGKGEKKRPVWFGEMCAAALKRWKAERPETAGEYVFSIKNEPILPSSIYQILKRTLIRAGIEHIGHGPHSLRHRLGHRMSDAGVSPSVVKTVLGHSKSSVTVEYYFPEDWDRASDAVNRLATDDNETGDQENIIQFPKRKTP